MTIQEISALKRRATKGKKAREEVLFLEILEDGSIVYRKRLVDAFGRIKPEYWEPIRQQVFQRDGFRCVYCGSDGTGRNGLHCDHIVALSKGGSSSFLNLTTACGSCNASKRDMPLDQWLQKQKNTLQPS